MKKLFSMVLTLLVSTAFAQPYKCVINGKTEYTDKPCPAGTGQPLVVTPPPSAAERQEAEQRAQTQKQRAGELEAARKAREPQPEPAPSAVTEAKTEDAVSPEEGASQGAAGRTYRRERPEQVKQENRPEVKPLPVIPFPKPTPK